MLLVRCYDDGRHKAAKIWILCYLPDLGLRAVCSWIIYFLRNFKWSPNAKRGMLRYPDWEYKSGYERGWWGVGSRYKSYRAVMWVRYKRWILDWHSNFHVFVNDSAVLFDIGIVLALEKFKESYRAGGCTKTLIK